MENWLSGFISAVNGVLWDYILIYALIGIGLFFTLYLGMPQILRFREGIRTVFGGVLDKNSQRDANSLSPFQALAVAISAQVGTGNVVGVATAIAAGGAGSVFWMWLSSLFGMATIFAEAILAQKYRVLSQGKFIGGPAFYITLGLTPKIGARAARCLAVFFSLAIIIALGFIGNATQANSIASTVTAAYGISELSVGLVIAAAAGLIILGGIGRIANVAQMVVPFMAMIYLLGAVFILFTFSSEIVPMFQNIFTAALSPAAVGGGLAGIGMKEAIRYGVARGLFSNEAGMGSTPHAHAAASVQHPVQQGMAAFIGVFNTTLICTATALIILLTEANTPGLQGAQVTQKAFSIAFGNMGEQLLAICLTFFAFTTIIGWYYFAESNIRFLFQDRFLAPFRILVLVSIVLGTLGKVNLVWEMSDMFNGFMVLPNLLALFLLRKEIKEIYIDYCQQKQRGDTLNFKYPDHSSFHQ